jgi:hypothetical protein
MPIRTAVHTLVARMESILAETEAEIRDEIEAERDRLAARVAELEAALAAFAEKETAAKTQGK